MNRWLWKHRLSLAGAIAFLSIPTALLSSFYTPLCLVSGACIIVSVTVAFLLEEPHAPF